jgi:lipopolysaccharide/colanic/teichoic acid biosynthesis glycosyltransferase
MSIELEDLGKQTKDVEVEEEAGPSTKEEVVVSVAPTSSTSEEKRKIKRLLVVIVILSILLVLSIIAIVAVILVVYVNFPPDTQPTRFYDVNYLKYVSF